MGAGDLYYDLRVAVDGGVGEDALPIVMRGWASAADVVAELRMVADALEADLGLAPKPVPRSHTDVLSADGEVWRVVWPMLPVDGRAVVWCSGCGHEEEASGDHLQA